MKWLKYNQWKVWKIDLNPKNPFKESMAKHTFHSLLHKVAPVCLLIVSTDGISYQGKAMCSIVIKLYSKVQVNNMEKGNKPRL